MSVSMPRSLLLLLACVACLLTLPSSADAQPAEKAPEANQPRLWTTEWSFQEVDVERLLSRLHSIGIDVPVDAEGQASVEFTVSVPITALRDAKAYRFEGQLSSKRLRLDRLLLEDFRADVSYRDGVMRLSEMQGRWSDRDEKAFGRFQGDATAELSPRGDFSANLKTESLPIKPLFDLTGSNRRIGGVVSGELNFLAPLKKLKDFSAWNTVADVRIERLRIDDQIPLDVDTGPIQIRDGVIQLQSAVATASESPTARADLSGQIELIDRKRFQFRLRGNDVPLATVTNIFLGAQTAAGKLDIDATAEGEWAAGSWSLAGRLASPNLSVLSQDLGLLEHEFFFDEEQILLEPLNPAFKEGFLIERLAARHQLTPERLKITEISAELFGGSFTGQIFLARQDAELHHFQVAWDNLHPDINLAPFLGTQVCVSAKTSGEVDWQVSANSVERPAAHQGTTQIRLDEVQIRSGVIGNLSVHCQADQGVFSLKGEGEMFGGKLHIDTKTTINDNEAWPVLLTRPPVGDLSIKSAKANRFAKIVFPGSSRRWTGNLEAHLNWKPAATESGDNLGDASAQPILDLAATDLAVDGKPLARRLNARLRLLGDVVSIDRIGGMYAGGSLTAQGRWSLDRGPRQIQLRAYNVRVSEALLPILPDASTVVRGRVSGLLNLTFTDRLRARGSVAARDASLYSVPLGTVHSSVSVGVASNLSRWDVRLRSLQGELANGRISGEAQIASSLTRPDAVDLSSRWQVREVKFGKLLASLGASKEFAEGRLTGTVSVGGRGIRGLNDLRGRYDARLTATQASAVPGLAKTDQYLGLIPIASVRFDEGAIGGVLGGGAASVDELWLRGNRVRLFADGKVRLADSRMDLDVVVSTGNFALGDAKLVAFASQLAVQSWLPITTLVEVNRLLNDRTLHFDFVGPLADPRVRIKPLEIIREEAAAFLLREILVAASASSNN